MLRLARVLECKLLGREFAVGGQHPLAVDARLVADLLLVNPDCRFITVQGPPGTGKSHTITAIAFDCILNGKNVLILSDKQEALDVVEDKLKTALASVRQDDDFPDPILRLGKTGNTYTRLIIAVVMEAERNLQSDRHTLDSSIQAGPADSGPRLKEPVLLDVLTQAGNYDYGLGDTLENRERAVALYEQAARLGAAEAYVRLADLYAEGGDPDAGLRCLTRGAGNGLLDCWVALAFVYWGDNVYFDVAPQRDNARKAWRQFFRAVNPEKFDPEGTSLYFMLKQYIRIVHSHPDPADASVIRAFEPRFAQALAALPTEGERRTKLAELRQLMANLP